MSDHKAKMVLIRGLPGSGKSTLGKMLAKSGYIHLEADMYHMVNGEYKFKMENLKAAHEWCQRSAEMTLYKGFVGVVVSNTFTTKKELQPYFDIAGKFGIVPQVITCENTFPNVHDVPIEALDRMKQRWESDISSLFN